MERVELDYILHAPANLYKLQKMHFAYLYPDFVKHQQHLSSPGAIGRSLCDNRGLSGLIGSASRSGDLAKAGPILFSQCRLALKATARDMSADGKHSVRLCTGRLYYHLILFPYPK